MVIGTLIVRPKSAQLTKDVAFLVEMDPEIHVTIGSQKFKSSVAQGSGKNPVWPDQFNFRVMNDTLLTFTIYDHDDWSKSEFVAEGSCSIVNAFQGGKKTEFAACMRKGKNAGQVVFEFEFIPDAVSVQQVYQVQPALNVQQGFPQQISQTTQQNNFPQNSYPIQYQPQQFPPQQYPGQIPMQQYPPQQYPAQGYPPSGQAYPGAY
ncbi:C2 domain protein (macronuclear) [Tetrahymena thermophila SB210]|uniref:C2 domain protein n=1 Tax=Tetrahymena thermophila (strain SB210) TaxID=312017 RepID=Q23BZ8_TETTS|nr:C2 domain protein [Tetrahymena thermophila SB210]EAR93970.3 C2 domain protein [Tetrahymena thermophila SB210]|eukprot:XP_001014215.3 C2 domain protein [Tetrahymena thermophila SB210]